MSNRELLRQRLKKGVREPRLKHNAGRQQRKLLKHNDERNRASKRRERRGELQERGGSKESKLKLRLQLKRQRHMNGNTKRKDVAAAAVVNHAQDQEEG
ncbi:MAG: hypothetical protein WAM14_05610 [Candidatus Nitrosopolaris sp.]